MKIDFVLVNAVKMNTTRDLETQKWDTVPQLIRLDSIQTISPHVDWDENTCQVLLNSKLAGSGAVGAALIIVTENWLELGKRIGNIHVSSPI